MQKYVPHKYQEVATNHIVNNEVTEMASSKGNGSGLFLEMGLGKTVSTLTAIDILMYERREIKKVLVIAPKRVAEHTWGHEIKKWEHLQHLRLSVCTGSVRQRMAGLMAKADIYTINREQTQWLVSLLQNKWPFDMVVVDESSSFKNSTSGRFKALRQVRAVLNRIVLLTGTPAPQNLEDLWAQMYLVDRGERLEKTLGMYRKKYFVEGRRNAHTVFEYNLARGEEFEGDDINRIQIYDKISDVCLSMKAADWLDVPELINNYVDIHFPDALQKQYREFAKQAFMNLEGGQVTAMNRAALSNKLLQFCNGAVYDESKDVHEIHQLKIEALAEYMEAQQGQPVLCFYSFQHDVSRIMKSPAMKQYRPRKLGGPEDVDAWNRGEIPFLLAHPASAGHGLNMQEGGNRLVWFGVPWSVELYQQAVARLHRQGQASRVINTHIVITESFDYRVVKALADKAANQELLMQALKVTADDLGIRGVKFKSRGPVFM